MSEFDSVLDRNNWQWKEAWGPYGEESYYEFTGDFYIDSAKDELLELQEKVKFYEKKLSELKILEEMQEDFKEYYDNL